METQCERVLKYMRDFGSITPLEAMADLGVMRLAARISDLRRAGYEISRKNETAKNRYGRAVHFARYRLEETENAQ